jgi:hypothetical protein
VRPRPTSGSSRERSGETHYAAIPDVREHLRADVAPTLADAAGAATPGSVGLSMLPLLTNKNAPWRERFLIEHWGEGGVPA